MGEEREREGGGSEYESEREGGREGREKERERVGSHLEFSFTPVTCTAWSFDLKHSLP